jgi:hypothetical protein
MRAGAFGWRLATVAACAACFVERFAAADCPMVHYVGERLVSVRMDDPDGLVAQARIPTLESDLAVTIDNVHRIGGPSGTPALDGLRDLDHQSVLARLVRGGDGPRLEVDLVGARGEIAARARVPLLEGAAGPLVEDSFCRAARQLQGTVPLGSAAEWPPPLEDWWFVQLAPLRARAHAFRGAMQLSGGTARAQSFVGAVQASVFDNSAGSFDGLAQLGLRQNVAGQFRGLFQLALVVNVSDDGFALARIAGYNRSGDWSEVPHDLVVLLDLGIVNQSLSSGIAEGMAAGFANDSRVFLGGLQAAVYNEVRKSFDGIAQLGAWNVAGMLRGALQAGTVNSVGGSIEAGAQIGLVNIVGSVVLANQLGWVLTTSGGSFRGGVQAGAYNFVHDDFFGLTQAGVVNAVGRDLAGAQIAAATNFVDGAARGVQIAPVNLAGRTRGVQIGLVNVTGDLEGAQLGLVNISARGGLPLSPLANLGL